jgi:hypothetical protein
MLSACIPAPLLGLWTVSEFERSVCGSPVIAIDALTACTKFSGSGPKEMFWAVLEKFTDEERGLVLKFATGRVRLPVKLSVSWNEKPDTHHPTAATCSQALYMPRYSAEDIMATRLRYAVVNCMSIDTD